MRFLFYGLVAALIYSILKMLYKKFFQTKSSELPDNILLEKLEKLNQENILTTQELEYIRSKLYR